MNRFTRTLRRYAELARLSNAPTVITNVLVGVSLAGTAAPSIVTIDIVAAAMLLLYIAGMALNDAVDAPLDAIERPDRPIPSHRISRQAATIFASICILAALAIMAGFGGGALVITAALAAAIIVYDIAHKRIASSVILMGLCRSLVYLASAAAVAWPLDWPRAAPPAVAILLYIVMVTLVARIETSDHAGRRAWLALLLPVPALAIVFFLPPAPGRLLLPLLAGGILVLLLTAASFNLVRHRRISAAVHGWLAGICLVDAWFLALLDRPHLVIVCFVCYIITVIGHRHIMGT